MLLSIFLFLLKVVEVVDTVAVESEVVMAEEGQIEVIVVVMVGVAIEVVMVAVEIVTNMAAVEIVMDTVDEEAMDLAVVMGVVLTVADTDQDRVMEVSKGQNLAIVQELMERQLESDGVDPMNKLRHRKLSAIVLC
jgi:hypothetical protein